MITDEQIIRRYHLEAGNYDPGEEDRRAICQAVAEYLELNPTDVARVIACYEVPIGG